MEMSLGGPAAASADGGQQPRRRGELCVNLGPTLRLPRTHHVFVFSGCLTVSTGHLALRTTASATLPINSRVRPVRP